MERKSDGRRKKREEGKKDQITKCFYILIHARCEENSVLDVSPS